MPVMMVRVASISGWRTLYYKLLTQYTFVSLSVSLSPLSLTLSLLSVSHSLFVSLFICLPLTISSYLIVVNYSTCIYYYHHYKRTKKAR